MNFPRESRFEKLQREINAIDSYVHNFKAYDNPDTWEEMGCTLSDALRWLYEFENEIPQFVGLAARAYALLQLVTQAAGNVASWNIGHITHRDMHGYALPGDPGYTECRGGPYTCGGCDRCLRQQALSAELGFER